MAVVKSKTIQLPSWRILWELSKETQKLIRNLDAIAQLRKDLAKNVARVTSQVRKFRDKIKVSKNRLLSGDFVSLEEAQDLVKSIKEAEEEIEKIIKSEEVQKLLVERKGIVNQMRQARENVKTSADKIREILAIPEVQSFINSPPE